MSQLGVGALFRCIRDLPPSGRTEKQRLGRLAQVKAAIVVTKAVRAMVKEQGRLLTILLKKLTAEVDRLS